MNQKLSDWAGLAEIISSIAVVVSLVVLIVEIRGNTDEVRAAAQTNLSGRTQSLIMFNMSNPAWQAASFKENQGEELNPSEEALLGQGLGLRMKYTEESFLAYRNGRLDEEVWQTRAKQTLDALRNENDRRRWARRAESGWYVQGFVDFIDAEISRRYGE